MQNLDTKNRVLLIEFILKIRETRDSKPFFPLGVFQLVYK